MPTDEMAGLTDMERLSKVYGQRGYLVVVAAQEWKVGEIIREVYIEGVLTGIPFRVFAETDFPDFEKQLHAACPDGSMRRYVPYPEDYFFYRVETD